MAGHHGHASRVIADQLRQPAADIHRRMPVVGQRQDAARVLAPYPDEVGDTVDQHARLAGTRACQHQRVGLLAVVGDDALLHRVPQVLDDGRPRLGSGLAADLTAASGQPAFQELLLFEGEVFQRHPGRLGDGRQAALGELHHYVDLQDLSSVVERQGLEVGIDEAPPVLSQADGHGRAEDRQALVEADDIELVQPQQGAVQQSGGVSDPALDLQVGRQGMGKPSQSGFRQEVRPAGALRQTRQEVFQQQPGAVPPDSRGLLQRSPLAVQRHLPGFGVELARGQAAGGAVLAPAVVGDAADDAPEALRQGIGQTLVAQQLGGHAQVQRRCAALAQVRRRLAHVPDQRGLQFSGRFEAFEGRALHPRVDEGGQDRVVAGDAQPFQVVERVAHTLGAETGNAHQVVG